MLQIVGAVAAYFVILVQLRTALFTDVDVSTVPP